MSTIVIRKRSITELNSEIIVNAANEHLLFGSGVCGHIFMAAGVKKLQDACDQIGGCPAGSAVITPGFDLCKYIVHAVGPRWSGGKQRESELLYQCYQKCLDLAKENHCHTIGFPLISAGIFGYPKKEAWKVAIQAVSDWIHNDSSYGIDAVFAALDDEIISMGNDTLKQLAPDLCVISKHDWNTVEMPGECEVFTLNRAFDHQQMQLLKKGHLPQEMEDKWFFYMEDNVLYAHRSWTGYCIFMIEFHDDNNHKVTANRNPSQYSSTAEEDAEQLNELLNWWTQPSYDYYGQWMSETVKSLKNADVIRDQLKIGDHCADAIFFHKPEEPYGFLSNWYPSAFQLDGIRFTSCEQYLMYRKCIIFGDYDSANAVLATKDTAMQKKIGRNARGFQADVWEGIRQAVIVRGLIAKFEQNEDLKRQLVDTGDAYLVECAKSDSIWACGRTLNDERRLNTAEWNGRNLLGFALMEVRQEISLKNQQS